MRKLLIQFVTAALIGGMMGLLNPDAMAATTLKLTFAPSSSYQGEASKLTTGWHNYGGEPWGLDWGALSSDFTGWIRGWAYHSDSSAAIRTNLVASSGPWGLCENATRVDIYSESTSDLIGTYWLVHTTKWGTATTKDLYHSSAESWYNWLTVDMIRAADTCRWSGAHIHEVPDTVGIGTWTINESTYPYAKDNNSKYYPCYPYTESGNPCYMVNNTRSNWTRQLMWSE